MGGAVLRRNFGGFDEEDGPSAENADPAELAQLRSLLAHVTSEDLPGPGPDVVYH